jgi:(S)-2-hydroxy-acid oxidase/4-hydroxymandelate oxidase
MIVSLMSSVSLEDVAEKSNNPKLWLQTYIFKDRGLTEVMAERAENAGYRAIVVTVGCPVLGKRDRNLKNGFSLPGNVTAANFNRADLAVPDDALHTVDGADLDPAVTWKDIEWLRGGSRLPIVLKGLVNPLDVAPALDLQVSGIIISNHGGRQLDTTESTIRVLPEMAEAVSGRIPLLLDSGIRRGSDILKAIALGADAIFLGRPVLWALAVDGERGVLEAVGLLAEELRIAMQIAGCADIDEIKRNSLNIVRRRS